MKVLSHLSDGELVKLFTQGNNEAFNELLNRYKRKVFGCIRNTIKEREATEDIFQDVFLKVIIKLREESYEETGRFSFWLMRMAHNACIDYIRKNKNRKKVVFENEEQAIRVMDKALNASSNIKNLQDREYTRAALRKIVCNLPEAQREVFILRNLAGFSFKEIADYQGVSINTAIARMRYALRAIKKKLLNERIEYDQNIYFP